VNETARRAVEDPEFNPYADEPQQPTGAENLHGSTHTAKDDTRPDTTDTPPKHIDQYIDDTPEDRIDVAQKILSGEL